MPDTRKKIGKIIEAVFAHGRYTPKEPANLPEGQITIVEAVDQLENLIKEEREEAIKELKKTMEGHNFDKEWLYKFTKLVRFLR